MSTVNKYTAEPGAGITIPEILFGALLGFAAVSGIWISTSILLHLLQNL